MGIHKHDIELVDRLLPGWRDGYVAVLGSQNLRDPHRPFSEFAEAEGIVYVGFDLNEEDGCLPLDLCALLPAVWVEAFGVVLNFGTTEHCHDQEAVFANIDAMCAPGGAFVHAVPAKGFWPGHSPITYDEKFFPALCEKYRYELLHHRHPRPRAWTGQRRVHSEEAMRGYVVTLTNDPRSVKVAERCIASGLEHGFEIHMWPATEAEDARTYLAGTGIEIGTWKENWSFPDAVLGNFCSQYRIWRQITEPTLICEHDAIITAPLPDVEFSHVLQVGRPSFGLFKEAAEPGVHGLFSKPHFAGAHAYIVTAEGAEALVAGAHQYGALPVDAFFSLDRFPWLQELWPWIAEVRETFSTIQRRAGCLAKHQYNDQYQCAEVSRGG